MNKFKKALLSVFLYCTSLYAPFVSNFSYHVTIPQKSAWGLFQTTAPYYSLKNICAIEEFAKSSIQNKQSGVGTLSGKGFYFQLCPCLVNGVSYWNPLEILNQINPCYFQAMTQSGNQSSDNSCQGFGTLLLGQSGSPLSQNITGSASQQALLNSLSESFEHLGSESSEYQALYNEVKSQVNSLIAMDKMLQPDASQGQDFLSIPYLAFCTSYVDSFLTRTSIDKSAQTLFGNNLDVSTYFPGNQYALELDLVKAQQEKEVINVSKLEGKQVSITLGGPLVRAANLGVTKDLSAQELLINSNVIAPSVAKSFIQTQSSTQTITGAYDYIGSRALLEELFYLHLAMMQPLELAVGVNNPPAPQGLQTQAEFFQNNNTGIYAIVNNNNYGLYLPQSLNASITPVTVTSNNLANNGGLAPMPGMSGLPLLPGLSVASNSNEPQGIELQAVYQQLFFIARYIRALSLDNEGKRTAYAVQPCDTFAGVIIINNGGQNVDVGPVNTTNFVHSGYVNFFPTSDNVDSWNCGIDYYSGEKYRSMTFSIMPSGTTFTIQISEGFAGDISENSTQTIFTPGIKIVQPLSSSVSSLKQGLMGLATEDDVLITPQVEQFFNTTFTCPWAPIIEIVPGVSEPGFRLLALVRLNPFDFPLSYAGNFGNVQSFTSATLFGARQQLKSDLKQMRGTVINQNGIQVSETNMNLVKFNGAYGYNWTGQITIGKALSALEQASTTGFLSQQQLNLSDLGANLTAIGMKLYLQPSQTTSGTSSAQGAFVPLVTKKYLSQSVNEG